MAQDSELREGVREMVAPGNVNERLEEAIRDKPAARHLLDLRILAKAVLIAAVLTIICLLLFSPLIAGLVLVLSFFASWILLSMRSYEQRRPTVRRGERHEAGDREDEGED